MTSKDYEKQHQYEQDNMKYQATLNEQAAQANQIRAKEMWDYTSYPNQVKNLKAAGLNPALLYGQGGGGGGTTAGAGQNAGAGLSQSRTMEIKNQQRELALQAAQQMASIKVLESEAKKNDAEAREKEQNIEESKATVDNLIQQTKSEGVKRDLMRSNIAVNEANERLIGIEERFKENGIKLQNQQIEMLKWEGKNLERKYDLLFQEIRKATTNADLEQRTLETKVQEETQKLRNMVKQWHLMNSEINLNEQQVQRLIIVTGKQIGRAHV